MTKEAARAPHRLAGQVVDAGLRPQGGASECALHRRVDAMPVARPALGRSRGRADRRVRLRRAAQRHDAARRARRRPGRRASTRRRRWARRRPPPRPARWAKCGAIRSRCCRSAAITSATISRTGSRWAQRVRAAAEDLQRQLVPHRRRTASSSGRASARTCACSPGSSSAAAARGARSRNARSGFEPDYGDLNWSGLDFAPDRFAEVMRVDAAAWARELASHDALFAKLGAKRPAALAAERGQLARAPGGLIGVAAERDAHSWRY